MLTTQQQTALDELMQSMPASPVPASTDQPGDAFLSPRPPTSAASGLASAGLVNLFEGLTGISTQDLRQKLQWLWSAKGDVERQALDWAERNPMDSAFAFLGASAYAFYQAERDENPKIATYVDAFYYISTCASVGYADIFAVTQTGKAIAALVMVIGPSLAANVLNRPVAPVASPVLPPVLPPD